MDDWVDPIYQEPWSEQKPGHLPANDDVYAAPEAEEGPNCLSHFSCFAAPSTPLQ